MRLCCAGLCCCCHGSVSSRYQCPWPAVHVDGGSQRDMASEAGGSKGSRTTGYHGNELWLIVAADRHAALKVQRYPSRHAGAQKSQTCVPAHVHALGGIYLRLRRDTASACLKSRICVTTATSMLLGCLSKKSSGLAPGRLCPRER